MPLPLQTYRVFPNPWAMIHAEKGPQGACPKAGREGSPLRFVGAERSSVVLEKRPKLDPRGDRVSISFTYPNLEPSLLKGKAEEVSAKAPDGHYYRDRLVDGSLIPADKRTADAVECRFASLEEAKAHGVADFDAHHGPGSWKELEKLLADQAKEPKEAEKATPTPVVTPEPEAKKAGS